ncbi:interleukin-17 receptor A [Rhinatrema bivittatum]|uniref:interleukin-17 receptor A n=1 Tax=Rhinatrema bivittatum TaxID=194408 RepID=UPI00112BEDC4|nr:interleukin-17 receptor A [Rhinatrema bivittatum]
MASSASGGIDLKFLRRYCDHCKSVSQDRRERDFPLSRRFFGRIGTFRCERFKFWHSGSALLRAMVPPFLLRSLFTLMGSLRLGAGAMRVLNSPPFSCSQMGLTCHVRNSSCMDESWLRPFHLTPSAPSSMDVSIAFTQDEGGHLVPVLQIEWKVATDASVLFLQGAELNVMQVSSNQHICVQFHFETNPPQQLRPDGNRWQFTFNRFMVDPGKTYGVTVHHLPKLGTNGDHNQKHKLFIVPDCKDEQMKQTEPCRRQGSHWEPLLEGVVQDKNLIVSFNPQNSSSGYRIFVTSFMPGFNDSCREYQHNIGELRSSSRTNITIALKDNREACCKYKIQIQAFFASCENDCWRHSVSLPCPPSSTPAPPPECVRQRHWCVFAVCVLLLVMVVAGIGYKVCVHHQTLDTNTTAENGKPDPHLSTQKVWIVYSADHPLYVHVVLKFADLLRATCGTEVALDLLQESEISKIGIAAWLNRQKQEMEEKSSKIIILCSRGTQAKWQAMMGEDKARVCLKQDCRQPSGDLCTPAFNLIMPDFGKPANFGKYIIAYFSAISNESDVPEPFKVTTKYQLMKEFEQIFFRIHNMEQHQPGWVYRVENIKHYTQNTSGQSLKEALIRFQDWQKKHPDWFERECLVSKDDLEEEVKLDNLMELLEYKGGIQKQQPIFQTSKSDKCFVVDLHVQENEEKIGMVEPLFHPVGQHGNSSLQTVISNDKSSTVQVVTPLPHLLGKNGIQQLQPYQDCMEETPLLRGKSSVRNDLLLNGDPECTSPTSGTESPRTSMPLPDELSVDVKRRLEELMLHQLYESIIPSEFSPTQNEEDQLRINAQYKAFEDQRPSLQSDQGYSSRMSPVSTEGPMEGENETSDQQISAEELESLKSIQRQYFLQNFGDSSFYQRVC